MRRFSSRALAVLPDGDRLIQLDAQLRQAIRKGQDPARRAQHQRRVERIRRSHDHLEFLWNGGDDFPDALDVSGTLLQPDNVRMFGKPRDEVRLQRHAGQLRNGIQHHGKLGRIGHAPVVLDERVRSERRFEEAGRLDERIIKAEFAAALHREIVSGVDSDPTPATRTRPGAAASRTAENTCSTSARVSSTDSPVEPTAT